jgi:ribosomal protein S18 acetylase RimI-like enzyme
MDWRLREVTDQDHDYLWRLHAATMRASVEPAIGWDEADERRRYFARFRPERSRIITLDGDDVGAFSAEWREGGLYLSGLQVAPEHQGRGIGAAVLRFLTAWAHAARLPVFLQVLKTNDPARRLYERHGFAIAGETATHWLMRTTPPVPVQRDPGLFD